MKNWEDVFNITKLAGATLYVNKADDSDAWIQFSDEINERLAEGEDCYDVFGTDGYAEWEQEITEKVGRAAKLEDYDAPSEPYTGAKVVWA